MMTVLKLNSPGSDSLGTSSWLFTGALYNGYGPPDGFCFDIFCGDDPIMDDRRMHDYNRDQKVQDFIKAVQDQVIIKRQPF